MTLAWIRELAPIIIHVNVDKILQILEDDSHYRNQFETSSSGGLLKPKMREKWERDLFLGAYDAPGTCNFNRCKYGVLNSMNDSRGVLMCRQYGDSYLVLKDVRLRCTFSPEDSANLRASRLAVLDYYAHVLLEYSNYELIQTVNVANSPSTFAVGDSAGVAPGKYKETQIHGEICFTKHAERFVVSERHRTESTISNRIRQLCQKHGWELSWMDEEHHRIANGVKPKVGTQEWRKRLVTLAEDSVADPAATTIPTTSVPTNQMMRNAPLVPHGLCRQGCGRSAAQGLSKRGKPMTTCCRGCALGFGHDMTCGSRTLSSVGPGKCRHGCGMDANPGTSLAGRPFDTCCRSCTLGFHDATCGTQKDLSNLVVVAGQCRMGCGRAVAVAKDGRKFDTCCRGCATGGNHSKTCVA